MNPTRNTPEIWKPVVGYETRYEVSSHGRVRTVARYLYPGAGRKPYWRRSLPMSPFVTKDGHLRVGLRDERGERRKHHIHVLVLEAFISPRPDRLIALHNDGDPQHNSPDNLRWGTHSDNVHDAVRHGTHWESKLERCKRGHLLAKWNLEPGDLRRRNTRTCRSCRYAHCLGQRRPEVKLNPKPWADGRYLRYLQDLGIHDPEFVAESIT